MDTKLKGDIGELAVSAKALEKGWEVLLPVGDRLPYDCVFVVNGNFIKIQVKTAWQEDSGAYVVDHRQAKTNRQTYKFTTYEQTDFDFLIAHIIERNEFYILPIEEMLKFFGKFVLINPNSSRGTTKAGQYCNRWDLITRVGQDGSSSVS